MRRLPLTTSKIIWLCHKHRVEYHHHDIVEEGRYRLPDLAKAVAVVYSSQYGSWQLAVTKDHKVIKPGDTMLRQIASLQRKLKNGIRIRRKQ